MPGKQIAFNSEGKKSNLSRVIKIHLQYLSSQYSHSFTANSLTMLKRETLLQIPQETLHSISKENFALKTFPPNHLHKFSLFRKESHKRERGRRGKALKYN